MLACTAPAYTCMNPLGVLGTLSSDYSLYKTVNHKHFRSHDAVCVFIILLTTPNWTKHVT